MYKELYLFIMIGLFSDKARFHREERRDENETYIDKMMHAQRVKRPSPENSKTKSYMFIFV